ncbi:MAG: RNA polymerase sigma factor [Planctomycetota bacterium]|jgi:RNA polymerase sigma-70 factor (ECF subfamily)
MMSDDVSDLSAALAGSREAFARLYDRHAGVVLSLCRNRLSLAEAEDAMQETFLRAYRRLDQLREPAGLRPWLYTIAKRVCSERHRSMDRRNHHETQAVIKRTASQCDEVSPADTVEQAEQLDRLTVALDSLSDNERLAIHLYYIDTNPQQAAAAVLGLSRSGFYKLLARARGHLARLMREVEKR